MFTVLIHWLGTGLYLSYLLSQCLEGWLGGAYAPNFFPVEIAVLVVCSLWASVGRTFLQRALFRSMRSICGHRALPVRCSRVQLGCPSFEWVVVTGVLAVCPFRVWIILMILAQVLWWLPQVWCRAAYPESCLRAGAQIREMEWL